VLIWFEDYALDTGRRELRRGAKLLSMEPQVFDLLVFLVTNRDRVVSKDDLLAGVWGGRIVSESTLASRINAVRRVIGDSGEQQRLVRTIIGKGVRFVGKVHETQPLLETDAAVIAGKLDARSPVLPDKPSVAVFPFVNLSGDPDQDYFADGMVEEIITALSRYPFLFVIARNSSFAYKSRQGEVTQVGRELGVRYVLEGSVRKEDARMRITVRLIEAESGKHVWADRYDRSLSNIFALQDEITEAVTTAIAPTIGDADRRVAMRKPPSNLDAWGAYQRGLWHISKFSSEDNTLAQKFFRQAIELDPNFSGGYGGLAVAHTQAAGIYQTYEPDEMLRAAELWARRAIEVDPNDAEAHGYHSNALWMLADFESAVAAAERALALSPNLARGHANLGCALIFSGRAQEGVAALEKSVKLDPYEPMLPSRLNLLTTGLYYAGKYEATVEAAKRTIRANPNYPLPYRWLAAALGQLGRVAEARQALETAISVAPDVFDRFVRGRVPWHRPEDHAHMIEGLRKAGWRV
jgi:adenylate cyclase